MIPETAVSHLQGRQTIHTPRLILHVVVLQPEIKMDHSHLSVDEGEETGEKIIFKPRDN